MVAPPDTVFLDGLDFFTAAVRRLDRTDWPRPSPCAGWRALDVLGHVGAGVRFGTELLGDAHPEWEPVDPPGAVVAGDPGTWWVRLGPHPGGRCRCRDPRRSDRVRARRDRPGAHRAAAQSEGVRRSGARAARRDTCRVLHRLDRAGSPMAAAG
ncbi:MAG: maleylpyruvate isomerase N-terminal domain-containing protein [Actinomycetota bacterium]